MSRFSFFICSARNLLLVGSDFPRASPVLPPSVLVIMTAHESPWVCFLISNMRYAHTPTRAH